MIFLLLTCKRTESWHYPADHSPRQAVLSQPRCSHCTVKGKDGLGRSLALLLHCAELFSGDSTFTRRSIFLKTMLLPDESICVSNVSFAMRRSRPVFFLRNRVLL